MRSRPGWSIASANGRRTCARCRTARASQAAFPPRPDRRNSTPRRQDGCRRSTRSASRRFAHRLERREVNRAAHRMRVENALQRGFIARIRFVERDTLARDLLDSFKRLAVAVDEVIDHDHVLATAQQLDTGMRADKARSAGDQNRAFQVHAKFPLVLIQSACHGRALPVPAAPTPTVASPPSVTYGTKPASVIRAAVAAAHVSSAGGQ